MAFASVRSDAAGTQGTNSASWTLDYPATISSGDLILVTIGRDGSSGTGAITGFTLLYNQASGTAARGLVFAKVADGTESGTFTYSPGASEQGAWRVAAYQDWYGTIASGVEVGGTATGTSTAPDPGSFDPSWGTEDTKWRAQVAYDDGRHTTFGYPTDYNLNQTADASGGIAGGTLMGASRNLNAASVDPGVFSSTSSGAWVAFVIAIRPAVENLDRSGSAPDVATATGTTSGGQKAVEGAAPDQATATDTSATAIKEGTGPAPDVSVTSDTSAAGFQGHAGSATTTAATDTTAGGLRASQGDGQLTAVTGATGAGAKALEAIAPDVTAATDITAAGASEHPGAASTSAATDITGAGLSERAGTAQTTAATDTSAEGAADEAGGGSGSAATTAATGVSATGVKGAARAVPDVSAATGVSAQAVKGAMGQAVSTAIGVLAATGFGTSNDDVRTGEAHLVLATGVMATGWKDVGWTDPGPFWLNQLGDVQGRKWLLERGRRSQRRAKWLKVRSQNRGG